jgi:hypothetical protein
MATCFQNIINLFMLNYLSTLFLLLTVLLFLLKDLIRIWIFRHFLFIQKENSTRTRNCKRSFLPEQGSPAQMRRERPQEVAQSAMNHVLWSVGHKIESPLPLPLCGHVKKKKKKVGRERDILLLQQENSFSHTHPEKDGT